MIDLNITDADVIIIPEQHLYHKAIITVPEMVPDNARICEEILQLIQKSYKPVVIFMGDIINYGFLAPYQLVFEETELSVEEAKKYAPEIYNLLNNFTYLIN